MSNGALKLLAGAGAKDDPVYVDDLFSTFLHVGNSTDNRSINNGIDLSGEGGLVWIKGRDSAYNNVLYDTARGATQEMYSNNTDRSAANANSLKAFNSNGFTIGTAGEVNNNLTDYVSWTFRKAEKFFDIVTWTGDGNSNKTISHNLGSTPGMMILKRTDGLPSAGNWIVFHRSINNDRYFMLNSTDDHGSYGYSWNPTATTFTAHLLGGADYSGNTSGHNYIAYLFAHNEQEFGAGSDESIIYCDSFSLTSGNVTNVNVGFEPQWLLIKKEEDQGWQLFDNMRGLFLAYDGDSIYSRTVNPNSAVVESNLQAAPLVNGFAIDANNWGAGDYVYMAIARSHKPASEFSATALHTTASARSTSDGAPPWWYSGFPVDMAFWKNWGGVGSTTQSDRIRGPRKLVTNDTDIDESLAGAKFDYQDGWYNNDGTQTDYRSSMFRRARGFFDIVTYTGTSSNQNVSHNLGAVPEMMWIKRRSIAANWAVYHSAMGNDKALSLNTDYSYLIATDSQFNSTTPTASVFTVGANYSTTNNTNATYVAYLFASVSGISKVGSYTGTGNNITVDCGFSAGARFVLIKRWDRVGGSFGSNGDWYWYTSSSGIVAGNDPYVFLNDTDAQVTNTDYIDPDNSGFIVTSSAPDALNASGGSYIFYAIA